MKLKLLSFIFVLTFAMTSFAALGVGGVSAATVQLEVGLNSPGGAQAHTVVGPAAATGGAITAFTHVTSNGVVIDNIDVEFGPAHTP